MMGQVDYKHIHLIDLSATSLPDFVHNLCIHARIGTSLQHYSTMVLVSQEKNTGKNTG
jgi:hypothetical protein